MNKLVTVKNSRDHLSETYQLIDCCLTSSVEVSRISAYK